MAPAKLSIQTSLRGFPYRRLTSFSAPENDASLSWLKFEEVLQGVCQTWGITRNAKDLVLSAEWGASTFLLDSQEEWHTYCSEFFVPRVDDKSRMQLTIIPRPALPGEYLNTADESGVRSPKLDDHFGDNGLPESQRSASGEKDGSHRSTARPSSSSDPESCNPATQPASTEQRNSTSISYTEDLLDQAAREALAFGTALGRDITNAVHSRIDQTLGRHRMFHQSGAEAAHSLLSFFESVLGCEAPTAPAATQTATTANEAQRAGAEPTNSRRSLSPPADAVESGRPPLRDSTSPAQPSSHYDQMMARSRAQGEALNAFFGAITQRRAERPGLEASEMTDSRSTDAPPAEPLHHSPVRTDPARPPAIDASQVIQSEEDRIAEQNAQLASLWETRLAQMGNSLSESQTYANRFPKSSIISNSSATPAGEGSETSAWEVLHDAASAGHDGAEATAASDPAVYDQQSAIEAQNQSLADAFSAMLARSRNEQSSQPSERSA